MAGDRCKKKKHNKIGGVGKNKEGKIFFPFNVIFFLSSFKAQVPGVQ